MHRKEAKALLASNKIKRTIRRNKHASGFMPCNDKEEQTIPPGYSCHKMDQDSFLSNADLGSIAAELTTRCDDEDEENISLSAEAAGGFDYINDLWGYESPRSNKMYELIGLWDGTSFVDITDSRNPIVLGFLEQAGELPPGNCDDGYWQDIKVVNNIAYIGAEPQRTVEFRFSISLVSTLSRVPRDLHPLLVVKLPVSSLTMLSERLEPQTISLHFQKRTKFSSLDLVHHLMTHLLVILIGVRLLLCWMRPRTYSILQSSA